MLDKFNFYDLLGYLLPGATVVLTLYWLGLVALGLPLNLPPSDFGSSVFFLGLSYLVGQLVHNIASIYEERINRATKGQRLSERLLLKDRTRIGPGEGRPFSDDLTDRILKAVDKVWGSHADLAEVFEECYALIVGQGVAQHTEIFLALNGLARSMIVASSVGVLVGAWLVWNQIELYAMHIAGISQPSMGIWSLSQQQLLFGSIATVGFALTIPIWHRMFASFRAYFASSVYYSFLAWYGQKYPAQP